MKRVLGVALLTGVALFAANQPLPVCAETEQIDLKALAKKARPAVMLLVMADAAGKEIATGTGFLVSADGKLITNFHVIEKAASAIAKAENGGKFEVEGVLAADPKNDLVLLKIKGKDLPFLTLGKSENIEVGTRIAVIGSPLGLEGTLSEGIVSAVRESEEFRLLQLTAAISPGSSGSPVLNGSGAVVGIARMLMRTGQLLNFAVPVESATALIGNPQRSRPVRPLVEFRGETDEELINAFPETKAFVAATDSNQYIDALKWAKALAQKLPNSEWAYYANGLALFHLKFYEDSENVFRQTIRLKPDFALGWLGLSATLREQRKNEQQVNASKQLGILRPRTKELSGSELARAGTIAFLTSQIEANPNHVPALSRRGRCRLLRNDLNGAIDDFTRALRLSPQISDLYTDRAMAFTRVGAFESAWYDLRQSAKGRPATANSQNSRAYVFYRSAKYTEAIKEATEGIFLDPTYPFTYSTRGFSRLALGQEEEARSDFRESLALKLNLGMGRDSLLYSTGALHFLDKEYTAAITAWRKNIEILPVAQHDLLPWIQIAEQRMKTR